MKTLAQIRAANALRYRALVQEQLDRPGQGDALSGFPMLIKANGLIAALAFATELKREKGGELHRKRPAECAIAEAIAAHLSHNQQEERVAITTAAEPHDLLVELASGDASKLRRATTETLAFLNYLKRFVA